MIYPELVQPGEDQGVLIQFGPPEVCWNSPHDLELLEKVEWRDHLERRGWRIKDYGRDLELMPMSYGGWFR